MSPDRDTTYDPPLWARLDTYVEGLQDEYEEQFVDPDDDRGQRLVRAMDDIEHQALKLLTTGAVPSEIAAKLEDFNPGESASEKVLELLKYDFVRDRIQFAVARDGARRLADIDQRILIMLLGFLLLLRSDPSQTAIKYFERAARLYLAGFESEVTILCGAVVEAALSARVPNDVLHAAGLKPQFKKEDDFSIKQRETFALAEELITDHDCQKMRELRDWRNYALHIQPDIGPKPEQPLLRAAQLLGVLLPRVIPE